MLHQGQALSPGAGDGTRTHITKLEDSLEVPAAEPVENLLRTARAETLR